ncbi:MFS transporter [Rhodococcoides yunnanense]|uniref:MFS transporter n=1 Tax=Rhodococcoides yunnanense TaxID=278209 RepID=UPI0022CCAAFC|nr:MFS transporter [Rhodococcus yunnanensis]
MRNALRPASFTAGTLTLLGTLYFAQGVPFGFFTQALPVVLRESGYSLVQISAAGVLFLPWGLKFLWAPYVDRYGTRRRWLLTLQSAAAAIALALSFLDLSSTLQWLFLGIFVMNAVSATQDIATDGIAVRTLSVAQRGLGNGLQVGAYRIGMVCGGGVLLWLFSFAGWRALFVAMAALLLIATIPVWLMRGQLSAADAAGEQDADAAGEQDADAAGEQDADAAGERDEVDAPARLAITWWYRLRRPGMFAFIALIIGFKFGNSMGSALVGPFLSDSGLTLGQIALVEGGVSSVAALGGAALGAWLSFRYGRRNALLVGGVSQTLSLGLYVAASMGIGGFPLLVTANITEHVLGGAATVAVFALMMDASEKRFAGSDYTLIACAVVFAQGAAGLAAGVVGDLFGYTAMFGSALVLSGIGCAALIVALDRGVGPSGLRDALTSTRRTDRHRRLPITGH